MKMKKKTMTSVRRNVERELGRGLYDAWWLVESVLSCTASLVWYLSLTSQVLLIMFGVAVVIEFVRDALEVMGGVLSPLTGVLDVMFTAIGIIFDAVIAAIRVVTFGLVHIRPLDPVKMYKSIGAFLETITHVKVDCAGYTTWPHVLGFFIGQGTRDTICPILRFVYPAPELRVPMMAMLGWLSLDPDPNGNNCQDTASDWLCACLGIGYLVIDFLLPLFLGILIVGSYWPLIKELLHMLRKTIHFFIHSIVIRIVHGELRALSHLGRTWDHFWCYHALTRKRA